MFHILFLPIVLASIISWGSSNRHYSVTNKIHCLMHLLSLVLLVALPIVFNKLSMTWAFDITQNIHLQLRLDYFTWILCCYISLLSFIIITFSSRYLLFDEGQQRFLVKLSLLTIATMILCLSDNLFTAFCGWQASSLLLYSALRHYKKRKQTINSLKVILPCNLLADGCLLLAVILSSSIPTLNINIKYGLIVLAIAGRAAQFPFHNWLLNSMEAPTPLSAMMHSGIVNSGAILLAKNSLDLVNAPVIMAILCSIGLISMLMAKFFMLTQPDVKRKLAYSTVGQMGYMLLQCGLGCFVSAVFHLIAHGFYKSYLFLNSGSTLSNPSAEISQQPATMFRKITTAAIVMVGAVILLHYNINALSLLFMISTLYGLLIRIEKIKHYFCSMAIIALSLVVMLFLEHSLHQIAGTNIMENANNSLQFALIFFVLTGCTAYYLLATLKPKLQLISSNKSLNIRDIITLLVTPLDTRATPTIRLSLSKRSYSS